MAININYLLLAVPLFCVGSIVFNILLNVMVTKSFISNDENLYKKFFKFIILSFGLIISIVTMFAGMILLVRFGMLLVRSGIFSSILSGLNKQ